MTRQLLDRVLPQQLAERRQVIDCKVQFQDLSRLAEIVQSDLAVLTAGERPAKWRDVPVRIRIKVDFAHFGDGLPLLIGEVATTLNAVCQRCLEACTVPLNTTLRYLLLPAGADVDAIENGNCEIWELAEKTMRPIDIVEEALIMAMPFPVLHRSADECGPLAQEFSPVSADRARPFAGLKAQLDESN